MSQSAGLSHFEQVNLGGNQPSGDRQGENAGPGPVSPEDEKDFRQLQDWWIQARTNQAAGRYEMALDEDFYDGLQWSEADQMVVEGRGQAALVFNQIKPVIDWISGTERRAKVDFHVFPRTEDDRQGAETKTELMKYVDDVSHADHHRSQAFKEAATVGIGWLEDGVLADPTQEPIYSRSESWRNMWPDLLAKEPDLDDGRYMFRTRWTDVDIGKAMFPGYEHAIESAARVNDLFGGNDDDDAFTSQLYYQTDSQGRELPRRTYIEDANYATSSRRTRCKLIEAWYRKPVRRQVVHMFDPRAPGYHRFQGQSVDPQQLPPDVQRGLQDGYASLYEAIKLEMWCAMFVDGTLLQNHKSPYRHDKFPFTPIIAFRRKRDGAFYGFVRNQRDPQEDLNKRRSKALYILSSKQVIAEEDAVEDIEEAREEVARPDGWITTRKNKKLEIVQDKGDVSAHMEYEKMDREYVRETGGVTSENLGHQTNATSGRAIEARQSEGDVTTTEVFDNKHFALQIQGEKRLSLIEQFMAAPKQIRITSDRGANQFKMINDPQGMDEQNQPVVENDITASMADFVIDMVDYRRTVRQAKLDQLFEMVGTVGKFNPEAGFALLDLIVDMDDDLPNRETMVARIRKLNGQPDPSLEGTPEMKAQEDEKAQADQANAAMQARANEAKIAKDEGAAALARQQAMATATTTIQTAMATSEQLAANPLAASLIDAILDFVNKSAAGPAPMEAATPAPLEESMGAQPPPAPPGAPPVM